MKQALKIIPAFWALSLIVIILTWVLSLALPLASLYLLGKFQPFYTKEDIAHFKTVTLKSEYQKRLNPNIIKWKKDIYILIHGKANKHDLNTLKQVMRELNSLQSQIKLYFVTKDSPKVNMHFYFQPEPRFKALDSHYIPTNWGYFSLNVLYQGEIKNATVLISTTGLTQTERNHIIREEFTQSLGLVNDTENYKDSIFYKPWSQTTSFSLEDKKLIHLLYSPLIRAGDYSSEIDKNINLSNRFIQCVTQLKCIQTNELPNK